MNFNDFLGADFFRESFVNSISKDKLSHALILTGPKIAGKYEFARVMARAILCEGTNPPCGICHSCTQDIHGNSPSVTVIAPTTSVFRVEDVNKVIDQVNMKSWSGRRKILILKSADSMNAAAQNRLLKTLEEPVGDTVIILVCDSLSPLLPTIISRCQVYHMPKTTNAKIQKHLEGLGVEEEKVRLITGLSEGYIQKALTLLKDEDGIKAYQDGLNMLVRLTKPGGALSITSSFPTDRNEFIKLLGIFQYILSQCIGVLVGSLKNNDVAEFADATGIDGILGLQSCVIQAEIKLSSMGTLNIIRDSLLCDMEDILLARI